MAKEKFGETGKIGLIAGTITLCLCMIGLVESFDQRDIITDTFTLGQLLLYVGAIVAGFIVVTRQAFNKLWVKLLHGAIAGALSGIAPFVLILITLRWETIRDSFINVSPDLISIMTLGQESLVAGSLRLIGIFTFLGLVGVLFTMIPARIRKAIMTGLLWSLTLGMMSEILVGMLRSRLSKESMGSLFGKSGLQLNAFVIVFVLIVAFSYWWRQSGQAGYEQTRSKLTVKQRSWSGRVGYVVLFIFLMILPSFLGVYLSEIFNNVGLYILMGLGLNIAVGLAGLLDLGYVTNFAVGAYVMALLTTSSEYGVNDPISFWLALPICLAAAMFTGFFFALPVLKMRGDYLAIATLGFGEIVRILARSDALKNVIGGAQGILQVPQARIAGFLGEMLIRITTPINAFLSQYNLGVLSGEEGVVLFGKPPQLYYIMLLGSLFMLFISRRLNNSRTGRRWMAIREDEDVAAAMGINTTNAKVLAFTLSAASGGIAGAIFAAKLGSIFPHSFQLLISVNVLSLIIVGGIGSLPGVIVGAFALIGIPELLREFAEFRLLLYGIALIAMMLVRPEGLWPSETQKREMARGDESGGGGLTAVSSGSVQAVNPSGD